MLTALLALYSCRPSSEPEITTAPIETAEEPDDAPVLRFGLVESDYHWDTRSVQANEFFGSILSNQGLPLETVQQTIDAARELFDPRKLRVGQTLHFATEHRSGELACMVLEKNPVEYLVFDWRKAVHVHSGEHPVEIVERQAYGTIESSLYQSLSNANASPELAMTMADIFAWTVDFYRVQRGDEFRVIYHEEHVGGQVVGMGEIAACWFKHGDRLLEAYPVEKEGKVDWYSWEGEQLRKAFLKSPLKFSRISSRYNKKRFHPVLKRVKAHLGTDYAAPSGTPILAVGDGMVIKSEYKGGNGNYVKIRHNSTYETQYLHMSKRAVKVGEQVIQGQVIGYVGSTGLATGPHVCFRFWKNGEQVDHLKEDFPAADPLTPEEVRTFQQQHAATRKRLESLNNADTIEP